tara:strand:+ start:563 stop:928 length:366 start_codon:yes stop_codon:yes gene_type:complete
MAIVQITLTFDGMNVSAQVGDTAYFSIASNSIGGFDTDILGNVRKLGPILNIDGNKITVQYDDNIFPHFIENGPYFISFVKDKKVNTSSLAGYYADVKFSNNSKEKIELFAVNSEISESSK